MIARLTIRDLAIVDACDLTLAGGYTVLTGETGAGKSLLVDAISLLMGERADATLVRSGAARAVVEGTLDGVAPHVRRVLVDAGVLPDEDGVAEEPVLLRREIGADGRSRAWINDRTVTLATLRSVGGASIDLCGQHAQQSLTDRATHLAALDAFAGRTADREELTAVVERRDGLRRALAHEQSARDERARRADVLAFHAEEIDRLDPQPGEIEALKGERDVLRHAERLARGVGEVSRDVYEADGAAAAAIARGERVLGELAGIDPRLAPLARQLADARTLVEDAGRALVSYAAHASADPGRLEALENRLHALQALAGKHGGSIDAVLAYRGEIRREQDAASAADDAVASLTAALQSAEGEVASRAAALTAARRASAQPLAASVRAVLGELGMGEADVAFAFDELEQPGATGAEAAELLLAPNPGEEMRPLAKIASGGELSRVLLALRSVLYEPGGPECLIFDEIDQGVGASAAEAVAERLRRASLDAQVIAITHMPVLAAYADHHLLVEKSVEDGRTSVSVRALDAEGRVAEIARMLAGELARKEAVAHARALRSSARAGGRTRAGAGTGA